MAGTTHIKHPERILITSALPYVNNIPHVGNIIGCVLSADVFARYMRSQGNTVLYVCGTDEHGTATETKALEEGLTPRQICDKYHAIHKQVYAWFNISFDHFGRTSAENHAQITTEIFESLRARGFVKTKDVEQTYCETCTKFLADRFVEGECPHCHFANARGDQCDSCGKLLDPLELINPVCKVCGKPPVRRTSTHLFLDLAKLQQELEPWVASQAKAGWWTQNAITTTKGWLERGLEPRAITRDLSWGIPVPDMPGKVFYVWFDAPIGYISITGQKDGEDWRSWWQDPEHVRLYQFMAKDNIPFHTILFPASLIGTGERWTLLHHIDSTEYLQHEDGKFSKSRKTGLFGDDAMKCSLPADVFRYYLLVNRPETADTVFSWTDLQEKLNKELLANLGNLVNRTLSFIAQFQGSTVHEAVLDETAANFWEWVSEQEVQVTDELEHCHEKDALRRVMAISSRGNQYFQEQQPWRTRKDDPESCRRALFVLTNLIKDLAVLIEPFLPDTANAITQQLNVPKRTWRDLGDLSLKNHRIGTPAVLFQKLEDKQLAEIKAGLTGGAGGASGASGAPALKPLQLRAGRITEVRQHPDAQKLFVETVDFGDHQRTIVSGLVGHYTADELRGKTCVFVTNLAPANLRGVMSDGMILAAQSPDKVEVVTVAADPGSVLVDTTERITIEDFAKHKIETTDYKVSLDGAPLLCQGKPVMTHHVKTGKVR